MRLNTLQGKSSFTLTTPKHELLFSHGALIAVRVKSSTGQSCVVYCKKILSRDATQNHLKLFIQETDEIKTMPNSWFNELDIDLVVKH
jgi:hypothetical protein